MSNLCPYLQCVILSSLFFPASFYFSFFSLSFPCHICDISIYRPLSLSFPSTDIGFWFVVRTTKSFLDQKPLWKWGSALLHVRGLSHAMNLCLLGWSKVSSKPFPNSLRHCMGHSTNHWPLRLSTLNFAGDKSCDTLPSTC